MAAKQSTADNRLTIDFTGLCVFVTNDSKDPKGLKVILARDPDGKMVHRPVLSFHVKYFARFTGKAAMQVIQLPNGDQIASWDLSHRVLRLKEWEDSYPKRVTVCRGKPPLPECPPDPATEMDARWIPSLKTVSGSGEVIAEYLGDDPPSSGTSALAARFDSQSGYLFSNFEINHRSPMEPWRFKDKGIDHAQYLADTARLELRSMSVKEPVVAFEASVLGAKAERKLERLELRPQDGRIEVSISNLPETLPERDEKSGMWRASKAGGMAPGKGMQHFALYYNLLKNPKWRPIPVPVKDYSYKAMALSRSANRDSGGVMHADAHGVAPVKCTPGMVP
jgi:hypothetical protein